MVLRFKKIWFSTFFSLIVLFSVGQTVSKADTLKLLVIGNSFSQNATRYLNSLAEEGGHNLFVGHAEIGGCTLKRHWELAELAKTKPDNPDGKPYNGRSLQEMLSDEKWDLVTIQQYSLHSSDLNTYIPYAQKLYDLIKAIQPQAKVAIHQTWAYRSDSKDFGQIGENKHCRSEKEMWEESRSAYHRIASELGIEVIPVGDAFWKVSSNKKWEFKPDGDFNYSDPHFSDLPKEFNSLHTGYYWDNYKTFSFDSHHANEAGCYLGALVWYSFLFNDSPVWLKFVPEGVPHDFSIYLKKIARSVTK